MPAKRSQDISVDTVPGEKPRRGASLVEVGGEGQAVAIRWTNWGPEEERSVPHDRTAEFVDVPAVKQEF